MSTLLDIDSTRTTNQAADRLRTTMAAIRISLSWLGVRKTLTPEQRSQAADTFGARGDFLSAGKKLLDNRHPAFRSVTAVKGRLLSYTNAMSLPYPEPGVRLVRQDRIVTIDNQLSLFKEELDQAVRRLDEHFLELKLAARERLGSLFNSADYSESLTGAFDVTWDFPSVEPPDYLRQLNPQLYEQQCQRMQNQFNEAVRLAEEAFTAEFGQLVSHLTERLGGQEDGKPKVFRDSVIGNLQEFFGRFRDLNVRSSDELDRLVTDAGQIVEGIQPQNLRDNGTLRQQVATEMSRVQSVLDGMLVDRPRRNILRRPR